MYASYDKSYRTVVQYEEIQILKDLNTVLKMPRYSPIEELNLDSSANQEAAQKFKILR